VEAVLAILGSRGPYWIPGTIILVVIALVVFYARGGRRGQEERVARNRRERS
jgi:hypothetical protein